MEISKAFPHVKQNKSWICKLSFEWHFYMNIMHCPVDTDTSPLKSWKKLRNMKRVFLKCANSPQERISRMGSKESRGDTEGDLASVQSSQSQRFFSEVWFFFKSYSDFHQNSVWNFSSYDFFSRKKWPFWSRQPHFLSRLLESLELLLTIAKLHIFLQEREI